MDNTQLAKSLADQSHPREIQHALSQIADRILAPNSEVRDSVRQFYPQVVEIAQTGQDELRLTAAWVMGQDNSVPSFHEELLRLLQDPNPMVRRNAALALVRFHDPSGLPEIRSMLSVSNVAATRGGVLDERLKPGEAINPGTLLGRIDEANTKAEVRSQIPGTIERWLVPDKSPVVVNQPILSVDPSSDEIWEALRALYLIGEAQDLAAVENFARGGGDLPANVRQQAEVTASAIRSRLAQAHQEAH